MDMIEIRQKKLRNKLSLQNAVKRILLCIGEDPNREGLIRTPFRYAKACEEWFGGYDKSPKDVLNRQFSKENYDQMIIEGPISFYSHCEHHITPFYGSVWIGYIPRSYVTGLDKMVKLVEIYARRLQIQERMTDQIADALHKFLKCYGVMVVIRANHLCIGSRETRNQTTETVTSAVRGVFDTNKDSRAEFLSLAKIQ